MARMSRFSMISPAGSLVFRTAIFTTARAKSSTRISWLGNTPETRDRPDWAWDGFLERHAGGALISLSSYPWSRGVRFCSDGCLHIS
jgi:hypothetical protein